MTRGQREYAIRKAAERFDRWRDHYDIINRFGTYYYEALGCVEDAVVIGIRVALGLRIRFQDGNLVDDDAKQPGRVKITDKTVYAIAQATSNFDEWVQATGVIPEYSVPYNSALDCIEDAAMIGLRVATGLAIRFETTGQGRLILDKKKDFGPRGERP